MTEAQIIEKIKYGLTLSSELPDLEFKTARNTIPKDIWRSISAFANRRGGGLIIFGVSQEKNAVVGCENLDSMQRKLIEYFNDKMSFVLRPAYHVIKLEEKTVLAVNVPQCPKDYMPCWYKPVGLPNGAYIREGNTSRRITDNEFRTYIATSKEFQFDSSEAINTTRASLSNHKILNLLHKREMDVKLNERQMKLIDALLVKGKLAVQDCQKILKGVPRATINKDLRDLKDLGVTTQKGASVNIFYTIAF